jgi:signal transduction histidine kinase
MAPNGRVLRRKYEPAVPPSGRFTFSPASHSIGDVTRRVQDLALGLVLATINVVSLLPYRGQQHPLGVALILVALQGVPLIWRRRFPIPVIVVIGSARVAYDVAGFTLAPFPLGPALAIFTVFERSCLVWRWVTGVLSVAGITISLSSPGHDEPYTAIYQGLIFVTAMAAGQISRARRASLQAQTTRADRAEAELELRAANERMTIARELHDVVAHHVSLIAVQAEAAASLLPGQPDRARSSVDIIASTARQALAELRRVLGVLRAPASSSVSAPSSSPAPSAVPAPSSAPAPSLADLDALLDQIRGAGLEVECTVSGEEFPLAPGVGLTAFRVVQEALTNTIRHSTAGSAAVALEYSPGQVTVAVTDRGSARAPSAAPVRAPSAAPVRAPSAASAAPVRAAAANGSGSGYGLAGIAERVASCGGHLAVGPDPDGGFSVIARLPSS